MGEFYIAPQQGEEMTEMVVASTILETIDQVTREVSVDGEGFIAVNCGDGRGEVSPRGDIYGKKLGGAPGYAWDVAVLQELQAPDTLSLNWTELTLSLEPAFQNAKIRPEVHSDEHAEGHGASKVDTAKTNGKTGCGRLERAEEIGVAAYKYVGEIIEKMLVDAPGVFDAHVDRIKQIAAINGQLVDRTLPDGTPFLQPGRQVMLNLVARGFGSRVLAGEHVEEDARYNLKPNTSNDNNADQRHFNMDGWITQRLFAANPEALPYDPMDVLIQDVLISYATKLVLDGSLDHVAVQQ